MKIISNYSINMAFNQLFISQQLIMLTNSLIISKLISNNEKFYKIIWN